MNEATFVAIQLASSGFCGGNPETILYHIDAELVLDMIRFMHFKEDYLAAADKLNMPEAPR